MNRWICNERVSGKGNVSLFIFPCSGGTASSYHKWHEYLNEEIDIYPVQYPMREKRAKDPMPDSITELAQQFCDACIDLIKEKKFAFLGHCAGSLVGYESALYLKKKHGLTLTSLFSVSIPAPNKFNPTYFEGKPVSQLDKDEFIRFLKAFMPLDDAFYNNRFVMEYYRKLTVKDFSLAEGYGYNKSVPLDGDIISFMGKEDPYMSEADSMLWKDFTLGKFENVMLDGNHDVCETCSRDICNYIQKSLTPEKTDIFWEEQ